jgi:putative lipoic acid-binding regulatory protein
VNHLISGKITIKKYPKKGIKKTISKGKYIVTVKVKVKDDLIYKALTKTVKVKVTVK